MEINKREKIMLIGLAVVVVFGIFDFILNRDTYVSFYSGESKTVKSGTTDQVAVKQEQNLSDDKKYRASDWGRDPFYDKPVQRVRKVQTVRTGPVEPVFNLKAISYKGENSVALINNSIITEGEWLDGYQVQNISKDRVVMKNHSRQIVLTLNNF